MVRMKPGGPCMFCKATESSSWYGRKATADDPGTPVCRSNRCKEKGGYATSRKKKTRADLFEEEDPEDIQRVSDIEAILGIR